MKVLKVLFVYTQNMVAIVLNFSKCNKVSYHLKEAHNKARFMSAQLRNDSATVAYIP